MLLGIGAVYLLYIAYKLFEGRNDPNTTMTLPVMILFIVLFVIAAGFLAVYAYRVWKKSKQEEEEQPSQEDGDSLK